MSIRIVWLQKSKNYPQIYIFISGFIVDASARGKHRLGPLKINLQFLEHHKDQLLELHQELIKTNYGQGPHRA